MNKTIILSALVSNLVACVGGDDLAATQQPIEFPASCAEAQIGKQARDGEHLLFVGGDAAKPFTAYCVDTATDSPKDYLTLPEGGTMNWSSYTAGGRSAGTTVVTRFDKVRIDPETLTIDVTDVTFAVSEGSVSHLGGAPITSMPFGTAMSCGGGYATAQVSVNGLPFTLANPFEVAGDAAAGFADPWQGDQTIEMWADGDCGWIAPGATAEAFKSTGLSLQLTYKK